MPIEIYNGGSGGGGTVSEIISSDGTLTVLNSTGPTVDILAPVQLPNGTFINDFVQWDGTQWINQASPPSVQLCNGAVSGNNGIAIGEYASNGTGFAGISIGTDCGNALQGSNSICIGTSAGLNGQGVDCTAIGHLSQNTYASFNATAMGSRAGNQNQGISSSAFGTLSGSINQGDNSIALGMKAGYTGQGIECIAIGYEGGQINQPDNSFFIGTTCIRDAVSATGTAKNLQYDTGTGEIYTNDNVVIPSNYQMTTPVNVNQNSDHTYTASEWLSGIITRDTNTDVDDTTPTATSIISLIPSAVVGLTFTTEIYNTSTKEIKEHLAGVGITFIHLSSTDLKLKKDEMRIFRCVITSISPDLIDIYSSRTHMNG